MTADVLTHNVGSVMVLDLSHRPWQRTHHSDCVLHSYSWLLPDDCLTPPATTMMARPPSSTHDNVTINNDPSLMFITTRWDPDVRTDNYTMSQSYVDNQSQITKYNYFNLRTLYNRVKRENFPYVFGRQTIWQKN